MAIMAPRFDFFYAADVPDRMNPLCMKMCEADRAIVYKSNYFLNLFYEQNSD